MEISKINILIAGWFSFENGHATAGDILSKDLICNWLDSASVKYSVALDPPFQNGLNWRYVNPAEYSHVIFVCGPFDKGKLEYDFFSKFSPHCRLIGLNLSMLIPISEWNPFDLLIERNSSRAVNPDLVFLAPSNKLPVVGICLVEDYQDSMVPYVNKLIKDFLTNFSAAIIYIDTRLDSNSTALRSPAEIESLISRVDVLITTRLHGMVLALKHGIPVVAIDPEKGGSKIRMQCELLNWKAVINADQLTFSELEKCVRYCLTKNAHNDALICSEFARKNISDIHHKLIDNLINSDEIDISFEKRVSNHLTNTWDIVTNKKLKKQKLSKKLRTAIKKVFS